MAEFVKSLDDIVGHKYVINFIKSKIEQDKVPNVILFCGNPGLGKTSIAKLLAIAINGNKESLVTSVIDRNESTDCIKLFNMSSVGDDTEEVIAEMQSTTFSSTKRKVIILDEVHGMTKKAQDAVLVNLEYLPENMYVFMCTTEISMLRESLISRCVTLNLNNLSYNEIKQVINRKISAMGLMFDLPKDMVLNLIASWANNQPRKALNLLESLDPNSVITKDDLSAFVSTNNVDIIISIVNYLYGSLTQGIEFIDTLTISDDLLSSMIEVLKVGLGYTSPLVSVDNKRVISKLFVVNDIANYLRFTISVCSYNRISRRVFLSKFIEYHYSIYKNGKSNFSNTNDIVKVMQSDIRTIGDNSMDRLRSGSVSSQDIDRELESSVSIDALFDLGQAVEEGK